MFMNPRYFWKIPFQGQGNILNFILNFLQAYSSNKYTLKKCLTNSFYFFSSPPEKLFVFILLTFEWLLFKIMTCHVLPCIYCYQFGICTSHLLVYVSQRRSKHLHSFFFFLNLGSAQDIQQEPLSMQSVSSSIKLVLEVKWWYRWFF